MYDFKEQLPTIRVLDGSKEYTFLPTLARPPSVKIDYELDEEDDDDTGDITGNLSQYTLNLIFGKTDAQLMDGSTAVPLSDINHQKHWNATFAVVGEAVPASKVNQRIAAAKMRREKLLLKQLSTAKERWASWAKQAPKALPPLSPPEPRPKPTVVHQAFKARTPPPIDFVQHPTLPTITVKTENGEQHEFMLNLAYKAERLKGDVTMYNLTTLFKLTSPVELVTSKGTPVPYNEANSCFEVGLWELRESPLLVSGAAKSLPEDSKQAAQKMGQMQAAKSRLVQALVSSKADAEQVYKGWYTDSGVAPNFGTSKEQPTASKDAKEEVPSVSAVPSVLRSPPPCLQQGAAPTERTAPPAQREVAPAPPAPKETKLSKVAPSPVTTEPKSAPSKPASQRTAKPRVTRAGISTSNPSTPKLKKEGPQRVEPREAAKPKTPQRSTRVSKDRPVQAAPAVTRTTQSKQIASSAPQVKRPGSGGTSTGLRASTTRSAPAAKPKKSPATSRASRRVSPPAPSPEPVSQEHSRMDGVGGSSRPTALFQIQPDPEADIALAAELQRRDQEEQRRRDTEVARRIATTERQRRTSRDHEYAEQLCQAEHMQLEENDRHFADIMRMSDPMAMMGDFGGPMRAPPRSSHRTPDIYEDEDEALARAILASQLDQ